MFQPSFQPVDSTSLSLLAPNASFTRKNYSTQRPTSTQTTNILTVGVKRFRCAEVLFQPSFQPAEIHVISFQINMECDVYVRKNLYANVVLSCGTYMFQEVFERMTQELTASAPSAMKIKVSLSAPNASAGRQCCCSPRPTSSQTVTSYCRRHDASVARKCCSSQDYNYRCIFRTNVFHASGPLPSPPQPVSCTVDGSGSGVRVGGTRVRSVSNDIDREQQRVFLRSSSDCP